MWVVYIKELTELIRDKKTLFFVIVLPLVVFPLLAIVMGGIVANIAYEQNQQVLKYQLINGNAAPDFAEKLQYHRDFVPAKKAVANALTKAVDNAVKNAHNEQALAAKIKKHITQGGVDIVIVVSKDHQTKRQAKQQDTWQVYYNNSSQLRTVKRKFNRLFKDYSEQVSLQLTANMQITAEQLAVMVEPIKIETVNTANKRENIGENIGGVLPYILIMLCLGGAMYPAIDLGAGEKERNTLESLLLSAMPLHQIILGKFFTIMTTGLVAALIGLISMALWGGIASAFINSAALIKILALFSISDLLVVLTMVVPTAALFSAILLAISIYARSFKEAQNYMGFITMTAFLPVMIAMIPGIKLDWFWACVPISNVALAIKELIKGTVDYVYIVTIFCSSLVFAVLAIAFCLHWFKKETVLFR